MLTLADMRSIARARIIDAAVLVRGGRYDTAFYLCGYAVEVSLKARVCRTLGWATFPVAPNELQRWHAPLKVHDFTLLAKWSGYQLQLDEPANQRHWLEVTKWNPDVRYRPSGKTTRAEAIRMIRSARLLSALLNPR